MQPAETTTRPPLWTKNFILISVATFLLFCGFQILLPVIPKFAFSLGADKSFIGLINGVFTITAVSLRPYIGRECDLRGRKSIYLLGLVIFLVSVFGYIWISSLLLLLLLRFIHGAGWAGASTAAGTIVADIVPAQRRGEGMGYYGLFSTLSMALAPALGLTLLTRYDYPVIYGISLVFTAGALIFAQALKLPPLTGPEGCVPSVRPPLFDKRALKVSVVMFFMTLSYGGIVTFLPLFAEERGIANIGPFFTVYAITLMIIRPPAGRYYDRKGPKLLVFWGMILVFVSNVILSQSFNLTSFLLCGIFFGLGFGIVQPTMMALAIQGIEPQRRGSVNGMVMSAFDLGIGIGSLGLGLIANTYSYSIMYMIASLGPLLGLAAFFLWPGRTVNAEET